MKRGLFFFGLLVFIGGYLFPAGLNDLYFLTSPNSSTIVDDSKASLINPARLSSVERLSFEFTSQELGISYLSFVLPTSSILGNIGFGLFNFRNEYNDPSAGYFISMGTRFWNVFDFGATVKTLSSSIYNPFDGYYFDTGFTFHPNSSLGLSFLKNEFLNDKIFLSFVAKNIGVNPRTTTQEPLSLRVGAAYDLSIIGTKVFVEKSFLSDRDVFLAGLEFSPVFSFVSDNKFFKLSGSYDFEQQDTKLCASIMIYNLNINLSYSFRSTLVFLGISGSFGKGRSEMSKEVYEKALEKYQNAIEIEDKDMEEAFNLYQSSYDDLNKAIRLDSENKKAILLKDNIEEKIENYKSRFKNLAENEDKKGNLLAAFLYYKKLYQIDKGDKQVKAKLDAISTNENFVKSIETEKKNLNNLYKKKKYVAAMQKAEFLSEIKPDDMEVRSLKSELGRILNDVAEKYYQKANLQYKSGNYTACIDSAKKALYYKPDHSGAKELYNIAVNQISKKRGLERAKEEYAKQNYIQSLKLVEAYLVKNPGNKEALALKDSIIQNLKDKIKDSLDRGIQYYNNGDYEKAVEELDKVLLVDSTNSVASDYRNRAATKLKALKKLEEFEEE
ncbi:MAG: tetratricopeptide repeat protein [Brevinematia bacterium]